MSFLNYRVNAMIKNHLRRQSKKNPEAHSSAQLDDNLPTLFLNNFVFRSGEKVQQVLNSNQPQQEEPLAQPQQEKLSNKPKKSYEDVIYEPLFGKEQFNGSSRFSIFGVNGRTYHAIDNGERTFVFRTDGTRDIPYEIIEGYLCFPENQMNKFTVEKNDEQDLVELVKEKGMCLPVACYKIVGRIPTNLFVG